MEPVTFIQIQKESEELWQKLLRKRSTCMYQVCNKTAINSHVIQNKYILKPIAPKKHLYCLEPHSIFDKETRFSYKRKGINNVLTFSGFCIYHDSKIFSFIENKDVDWLNPKSQFLLGYRSICRELYIKQISVELHKAILARFFLPPEIEHEMEMEIFGLAKGIEDMSRYKKILEIEITKNDYSNYNFETIILPFSIELCVSSPISVSYSEDVPNKDLAEADFVETNIVNVFPYKGESVVVIGYANGFDNRWAKNFSKQIKTLDIDLICKALNDLILFRSEFHCMSEKLYQTISDDEMKEFFKIWEEVIYLRSYKLDTHLNIFNNFAKAIKINIIDQRTT